nr:hypothetical protein [Tanacetum cinerariifolium]
VARLRLRYLFVLLSSFAVTYAFAMFPCINRSKKTNIYCVAWLQNPSLAISPVVARLRLRYLFVLLSSFAVTYASATFPCIDRAHSHVEAFGKALHLLYRGFSYLYILCALLRRTLGFQVRIGERKSDEDEPKLLETTVGHAEQGDSESGGHGVGIDVVAKTIVEDVAPTQLKRQKKRKTKVADAGEPSHPAKKLRDNYGALGGPTFGGKSQSSIQRLLARAVQNVKDSHANNYEGATTTPTADPAAIAKEKLVGSSLFGADSPSTGESHPIPGGFFDCSGSDFLIGGIRTVMDPDFNLQKVCVPQWNVTNGSCLDDGDVCRKMVDEFAPLKFFCMSLSAEVRMHAKYNIRDRRRLNSIVEEKDALLKANDEEIRSLKAQLVLKKAKAARAIQKSRLDVTVDDLAASVKVREQEVADLDAIVTSVKLQNNNLVDHVHKLETSFSVLLKKVTTYKNCLSQLEKFQDERIKEMNDKFDKLDTDLVEMALHLEESKAVEKGMHDGLYAGITHGAEELKSNKDASIDTIMNLLCLEDSLAKKLGLTKSQPHVDQLTVPIHYSPNQGVIGALDLSLSLDVSSSRVWRIKENIAKHRSALRDVFVPLSKPLSVTALMGTESTLNVIPATVDTTTSLSVSPVSISLIPPISIDDYEAAHAKGEDSTGADVNPFLNVDDTELNIPQ